MRDIFASTTVCCESVNSLNLEPSSSSNIFHLTKGLLFVRWSSCPFDPLRINENHFRLRRYLGLQSFKQPCAERS